MWPTLNKDFIIIIDISIFAIKQIFFFFRGLSFRNEEVKFQK